ncbi:carbohydrate ABC transporter permease [Paenibacillus lutimineralis]|uniref:Sugar ABC transporter permease n=1 Tax=Paenibacillus lutimineralis TaxID=2707005 RepID=A0A3S9USH0_9BACL|nr:sugar ABC transporter permease [Paenibacillus lutimineralis]AZS13226.1 sugar ABC transporter permease [Paenibacillus lutimineralis]
MSDLLHKKNQKFYYLLIVPAFGLYMFALIIPLALGTIPSSFQKWSLLEQDKTFIGFDNYIKLFSDATFLHSLVFTIVLALFTILGTNIISFFVALLLDNKVYGKSITRSFFFIPNIISGVIVAFVWSFIFTGAIPTIADKLGMIWLAELSWFGSGGTAAFTVILVSIWQATGFLMILYIAGLQTIPKDVVEAAQLDGCTGFRKVRLIYIPLLMPTFTINLFVSIAGAFKAFDIPLALTGGGPFKSTQTVALNIYNDAFKTYQTGYASAKSVILLLIVAVIAIIQLRVTRKREVQY